MRIPTIGRKGPTPVWVSLILLCLSPLGAVAAAFLFIEGATTQAVLLSIMLVISTTQAALNVHRWWSARADAGNSA